MGSVLGYDGAQVTREPEARPPEQVRRCHELQRRCLDFARDQAMDAAALGLDPFGDAERMRLWAAAILGRFLMLPSGEEQALFGRFKQDVNLGSAALIDMIDQPWTETLLDALPLPLAGTASEPPMWLAGSLAAAAPLAGLAYTLGSFNLIAGDQLTDTGIGQVEVTVIKDGAGEIIPVGCMMTAFGEVRLRIPVLRRHTGSVIAIPLDKFMNSGVVRSLTRQQGKNGLHTMMSRSIEPMPLSTIRTLRAYQAGGRFLRTEPDGHLLVDVPRSDQPLSLLTLVVEPLPEAA
jgi:hypothetical protein